MKILHVCLGCFYIDNSTYQENLLPKYHKLLGYDVEIIASTLSFDEKGNACNVKARSYINEHGIPTNRLPYKKGVGTRLGKFFRVYEGFKQALECSNPDIIFVHGCQYWDIGILVKYAQKNNVVIYVDNHADFSNSARNWISKNILHGIIWKRCARKIEPYVKRFYGVLPARVDFLENIYKIPSEKVSLLVMGVDDELAEKVNTLENRMSVRHELGFTDEDFVIISGGKIDHAKRQVLTLLKVLNDHRTERVKMIIFGSVVDDMKEELLSLCDGIDIVYVGWLNTEQSARYLAAADLAVYPGRHSVFWEETVGLGIPMLVKAWDGTKHVNVNGNTRFVMGDTYEELQEKVFEIVENREGYAQMKLLALECKNVFSYREIAKRSIEVES